MTLVPKLESRAHAIRHLGEKGAQHFVILHKRRRQLKQDHSGLVFRVRDGLCEDLQYFSAVAQFAEMRDPLRRLEAETKCGRRQTRPFHNRARRRNLPKGVIDLRARKLFRVKWQHFRRGHFFRIERSFPFGVLKTRCAYPRMHEVKAIADRKKHCEPRDSHTCRAHRPPAALRTSRDSISSAPTDRDSGSKRDGRSCARDHPPLR